MSPFGSPSGKSRSKIEKIFQSVIQILIFFFQNYIAIICTNNCYWSIITTTLIERLICKTIQSIFLFTTLKTLRKILSIARKLYITTGSFLNRESKVKIEIENPSQNRKSNSTSDIKVEIENRNRKSTTIEKIENRKSKKNFQSVSHSTSFARGDFPFLKFWIRRIFKIWN